MIDSNKSSTPQAVESASASPLTRGQVSLLVSVFVSLLMVLSGAALVWLWRDMLPDPIAIHWSGTGIPDGFASVTGFIWPLVGIMGISILLIAALGFAVQSSSQVLIRTLNGTIVFLGALALLITVFSIGPQRGLESAQDATLNDWALVATLAGSALIGMTAGLIGPRPKPAAKARNAPGAEAARAGIPAGEDFLWVGSTSINPMGLWVSVGLLTALFAFIGIASKSWSLFIISVPMIAVVILMSAFRVRITPAGLFVRAWLGWPKKQIAADQINEASVVEISPLQEFGGWGYRSQLGGAEGIVLRKGPGLKVRYGNTQELYVTLDSDAEEAAALLNTAADWAHGVVD